MSCKTTLEKLGKKAFISLTDEDRDTYTTASGIVAILSGPQVDSESAAALIVNKYQSIGERLITLTLNSLVAELTGKVTNTLAEACAAVRDFLQSKQGAFWAKWAHDIAGFIVMLLGLRENPAAIGNILEYVYQLIIKPLLG